VNVMREPFLIPAAGPSRSGARFDSAETQGGPSTRTRMEFAFGRFEGIRGRTDLLPAATEGSCAR
jgi:hypothetical protein